MTHFLYRGYWISLHPVRPGQYGIAVVFDRRHVRPNVASPEELSRFLREHRALRDLLGERPVVEGFGTRESVSRFVERQFSEERWFLTGSAGTAVDPMFATSSWFFTENNKLIGEFIQADRAGHTARLASYAHHFGIRVRSRFDKLRNPPGHALSRGSFDAWAAWFALRNRVYYNRIVPDALEDHRILLHFCRLHDIDCSCDGDVMSGGLSRLLKAADRLTEEFVEILEDKDAFFARNEGDFLDSASFDQDEILIAKTHAARDYAREVEIDKRSYTDFCRTLVRRLVDIAGEQWDEKKFLAAHAPEWDSGQSLADMYKGVVG